MCVRMLMVALFIVGKYWKSENIHKIHQEMNEIWIISAKKQKLDKCNLKKYAEPKKKKKRGQIVWCYLFLKEVFSSQRVKRNHNPHFNIYKLVIFISHILQERSLEQRERSTLPKRTWWENERAGAGGQVRARLWTKSSTGFPLKERKIGRKEAGEGERGEGWERKEPSSSAF